MSSNHLALATTCRRSGGVETEKVVRINIEEMLLSWHLLWYKGGPEELAGRSKERNERKRTKDRRVVSDCRLVLAPDFARAGAGGCRVEDRTTVITVSLIREH